jgi:hypothetical protein
LEDWKIGRLEDWKVGQLLILPYFHSSILPLYFAFFHFSTTLPKVIEIPKMITLILF